MIEIGPHEIAFDGHMLLMVAEKAVEVFRAAPTLVECPVPIQIYGDWHGQYSDLFRHMHLNGWPPTTRCLFLG